MKVLVVDDEIRELQRLSMALKKNGFSVLESSNAFRALEYLDQGVYMDLILTDYLMPEMNGMDLLMEIRGKRPQLPVIIMTADADREFAVKALHYKCNGLLEKPFTLDSLQKEIERVTLSVMEENNSSWVSALIPRIVHQINNPLMAITGACELGLLEMENPQIIRQCFEGILEATHKVNEINRNLIGMGPPLLSTQGEYSEIHQILEGCIEDFFGLMTLKGIEVNKEFVGRKVIVPAGRFALEQIFKNLIMNSIEAVEETETKSITLKTDLYGRDYVSVWIQDNGSGIPPELMPMIFKPFVTDKRGGNGLGLAVVKEIVEGMKGKVTVKSEEGEGTVFRVDLPFKEKS